MSSGAGKVVCVTGASGYIASWIVKFLLQRGYTVRATLRDPSNHKKVEHLVKLDGAKERLHLFKANLLEQGSQTFPNASFGWINVKDVANAHIKAYEIGSASGRYIVAERVAHLSEVAKILRDFYPTLQIAERLPKKRRRTWELNLYLWK